MKRQINTVQKEIKETTINTLQAEIQPKSKVKFRLVIKFWQHSVKMIFTLEEDLRKVKDRLRKVREGKSAKTERWS